jgi:hypothetical protein
MLIIICFYLIYGEIRIYFVVTIQSEVDKK